MLCKIDSWLGEEERERGGEERWQHCCHMVLVREERGEGKMEIMLGSWK